MRFQYPVTLLLPAIPVSTALNLSFVFGRIPSSSSLTADQVTGSTSTLSTYIPSSTSKDTFDMHDCDPECGSTNVRYLDFRDTPSTHNHTRSTSKYAFKTVSVSASASPSASVSSYMQIPTALPHSWNRLLPNQDGWMTRLSNYVSDIRTLLIITLIAYLWLRRSPTNGNSKQVKMLVRLHKIEKKDMDTKHQTELTSKDLVITAQDKQITTILHQNSLNNNARTSAEAGFREIILCKNPKTNFAKPSYRDVQTICNIAGNSLKNEVEYQEEIARLQTIIQNTQFPQQIYDATLAAKDLQIREITKKLAASTDSNSELLRTNTEQTITFNELKEKFNHVCRHCHVHLIPSPVWTTPSKNTGIDSGHYSVATSPVFTTRTELFDKSSVGQLQALDQELVLVTLPAVPQYDPSPITGYGYDYSYPQSLPSTAPGYVRGTPGKNQVPIGESAIPTVSGTIWVPPPIIFTEGIAEPTEPTNGKARGLDSMFGSTGSNASSFPSVLGTAKTTSQTTNGTPIVDAWAAKMQAAKAEKDKAERLLQSTNPCSTRHDDVAAKLAALKEFTGMGETSKFNSLFGIIGDSSSAKADPAPQKSLPNAMPLPSVQGDEMKATASEVALFTVKKNAQVAASHSLQDVPVVGAVSFQRQQHIDTVGSPSVTYFGEPNPDLGAFGNAATPTPQQSSTTPQRSCNPVAKEAERCNDTATISGYSNPEEVQKTIAIEVKGTTGNETAAAVIPPPSSSSQISASVSSSTTNTTASPQQSLKRSYTQDSTPQTKSQLTSTPYSSSSKKIAQVSKKYTIAPPPPAIPDPTSDDLARYEQDMIRSSAFPLPDDDKFDPWLAGEGDYPRQSGEWAGGDEDREDGGGGKRSRRD